MNEYEQVYWKQNQLVCGIDEVGRGCIAGPLVICGVILPINYTNDLINDSKTLSEKKRNLIFERILADALKVELLVVNEVTVDEENIYQATKNAMEQMLDIIDAKHYLLDAMKIDSVKSHDSIIKGDAKSISIAAASIVAKVVRDQIMHNLDEIYPEYGFKNHKGYPTKMHKEKLKEFGVLNFYRKSYKPVMEVLNLSNEK